MGAFFVNIQILAPGNDSVALRDKLVRDLSVTQTKKGWLSLETPEDADISFILSPIGQSPWMGYYDEALEEQDIDRLKKKAAQLSKKYKTATLSVLVHDSNSFHLSLHDKGVLLDELLFYPGQESVDFSKNDPLAWVPFMKQGHSFDDIIKAWEERGIFVEGILEKISSYLNMETNSVMTGHRYLLEEGCADHTVLSFKDPTVPTPPEPGPVKLSCDTGGALLLIKPQEIGKMSYHISNEGLASKGLQIMIGGPAIQDKRIEPLEAGMHYFRTYDPDIPHDQIELSIPFERYEHPDMGLTYTADFPDLLIKQGTDGWEHAPKNANKHLQWRMKRAHTSVVFHLTFMGMTDLQGHFYVWFIPHENLQGQYGDSVAINPSGFEHLIK